MLPAFITSTAFVAGSSPLAQLGQQAPDSIVALVLAVVLPLLTIGLLWLWLPKRVQALWTWLDSLIPGDFSALYRPTSLFIVGVLSIGVLVPALLAVLWSLGVDIDGPRDVVYSFVREVGQWARAQGIKVLVVLFIAFLIQRFITRAGSQEYRGVHSTGSTNDRG